MMEKVGETGQPWPLDDHGPVCLVSGGSGSVRGEVDGDDDVAVADNQRQQDSFVRLSDRYSARFKKMPKRCCCFS